MSTSNNDNTASDKTAFMLAEYEFMQKAFELQFNHFMGVFYFWIAVLTAPISASLLSGLGLQDSQKPIGFAVLCAFVSLLGIFLSVKMFDIRRSELRYAQKMNELRAYFWQTYKIEESHNLVPLGKNIDLNQIARTDFGMHMAWIMSLVHGILLAVSAYGLLSASLPSSVWIAIVGMPTQVFYIVTSVIIGLVVLGFNVWLYFRLFPKKTASSSRSQPTPTTDAQQPATRAG